MDSDSPLIVHGDTSKALLFPYTAKGQKVIFVEVVAQKVRQAAVAILRFLRERPGVQERFALPACENQLPEALVLDSAGFRLMGETEPLAQGLKSPHRPILASLILLFKGQDHQPGGFVPVVEGKGKRAILGDGQAFFTPILVGFGRLFGDKLHLPRMTMEQRYRQSLVCHSLIASSLFCYLPGNLFPAFRPEPLGPSGFSPSYHREVRKTCERRREFFASSGSRPSMNRLNVSAFRWSLLSSTYIAKYR